MRKSIIRRREV